MKREFQQVKKTAVAILLTASTILGTCSTVFANGTAERTDVLNYVSIGDSMTNGYGLDGYEPWIDADGDNITDAVEYINVNGYMQEAEGTGMGSYPVQFKNWLAEYTGKEVDLTQLATSALRAEDIWYVLSYGTEEAYEGDSYTHSNIPGRFDNYYEKCLGMQGNREFYLEKSVADYQGAVADADVVSIGVGSNNFSTYMVDHIGWLAYQLTGGDGSSAPENGFFAGSDTPNDRDFNTLPISDKAKVMAREIYSAVVTMIREAMAVQGVEMDEISTWLCEEIAQTATYTTIGYVIAYKGILDNVIRLTKGDAEIIIVGITNWLKGLDITVPVSEDGTEVFVLPFGDLLDVLYETANVYMAGLPALYETNTSGGEADHNGIYYAVTGSKVELIIEDMAEAGYITTEMTRRRMVRDMCAMVFPMLPLDVMTITVDDVKVYETESAAGNWGTINQYALAAYAAKYGIASEEDGIALVTRFYTSCVTYLGFEKAFLTSSKQDHIDATAFLALVGQNGGLMGAIGQCMTALNEMTGGDMSNVTPDILAEALTCTETMRSLLKLFVTIVIGEGVGCHPSEDGHIVIRDAMVKAYTEQYTGSDYVGERFKELIALVKEYGPEVKHEINKYEEAIGYTADSDSYYVAIGDSSVMPFYNMMNPADKLKAKDSYGYRLAVSEELNLNPKTQYKELGMVGMRAEDLLYILTEDAVLDTFGEAKIRALDAAKTSYKTEIARADLITVGLSNNTITNFVVSQVKNSITGKAVPIDWTICVGVDGAAEIAEILAKIKDYLVGSGIDSAIADMLVYAIESYAYGYVGYALNYSKAIDAIHVINPDALVVIVGSFNPIDDLAIIMEETVVPVGELVGSLVEMSNVYAVGYAVTTDNTVYVDAPDVETFFDEDGDVSLETYLLAIENGYEFHANANGHEYIKEQILNTLKKPSFVYGDINRDGMVDSLDVDLLFRYVIGFEGAELDSIQVMAADVNHDECIDSLDVDKLFRYVIGYDAYLN